MKLLILLLCLPISAFAWEQQTTGHCSPVMKDTKVGGSVTITCTGIPPKALENLNALLDSAKVIENLNELLDIRKQNLATKDRELKRIQLTVREKIQLAEDWRQKYLELEARLQAEAEDDELYQQAAEALQAGELEKAGALLDQLIAKQEKMVDKLAANHFNRAKVFQLQYEPVKALPHLKKAYNYRPENTEYAFAYALLLQEQNQFKQAIPIYEAVFEQFRESEDISSVAATLNNLAMLYRDINRYELAEKHFLEVLDIYQKLAEKNPQTYLFYVAIALNNLANLYYKTNHYKLTEKYYLEALDIHRNLAQKNPKIYLSYVAMTLYNLAISYHKVSLYNNINRYELAEKHYLEALDISKNLAKQNPQTYLSDVAMTLNNLATLYHKLSYYDLTEKLYLEALSIFRNLSQKNPQTYKPDLANTLGKLGGFHFMQGNNKKSQEYLNKALPIYRCWYKKYPNLYAEKLWVTLILSAIVSNDNPCHFLKEALSVAPDEQRKKAVLKMGAKFQFE